MNRFIRSLFSLTVMALIVLFGLSIQKTFLAWGALIALALLYSMFVWIREAWWTSLKYVLAVSVTILLVAGLHGTASSTTIPESLLLIPLLLLLAREQQNDQSLFVALAVVTVIVMAILAPTAAFNWVVLPVSLALYMSVRAINIYKGAYRISLQNIAELNAAQLELRQTNEALQAASLDSMRYAALAERTRLAQDIHDGLGHQLTSLIVQLQALEIMLPGDPVQASKAVPGMLAAARGAMEEVHKAVKTWRADEGSVGLTALQGLASQCASHAPFTIKFVQGNDLSDWPVGLSVALYRILQESLTNALRHAEASAVEIQVKEQADDVILTVSDNGCYTDKTSIKPGYGIQGMRERCRSLGGTCHISQNKLHGLVLQASLPIHADTKRE